MPETRQICRIGGLLLDAYVEPVETIDLTTDEDEPQLPQVWLGEWIVLDELDVSIDEDDLQVSESEEQSESSEDEASHNLAAQESDYDSHSESDYSTSESDDSGIEY